MWVLWLGQVAYHLGTSLSFSEVIVGMTWAGVCKGLLGGALHQGGHAQVSDSFWLILCSGQRKSFKVGQGEPHPHKLASKFEWKSKLPHTQAFLTERILVLTHKNSLNNLSHRLKVPALTFQALSLAPCVQSLKAHTATFQSRILWPLQSASGNHRCF